MMDTKPDTENPKEPSRLWREVRRGVSVIILAVMLIIVGSAASRLFGEMENREASCEITSDWELLWGVLAVSLVLSLVAGLAVAIWTLRWKTTPKGIVACFVLCLVVFAGAAISGAKYHEGKVGCLPPRTVQSAEP